MIKHLAVQNFKAIPWLETSRLMDFHQKTVVFSTDKPNVIVGPNGAGKSALIESIALRFMAFLCGRSALDGHYLRMVKTRKRGGRMSESGRGNGRFFRGCRSTPTKGRCATIVRTTSPAMITRLRQR